MEKPIKFNEKTKIEVDNLNQLKCNVNTFYKNSIIDDQVYVLQHLYLKFKEEGYEVRIIKNKITLEDFKYPVVAKPLPICMRKIKRDWTFDDIVDYLYKIISETVDKNTQIIVLYNFIFTIFVNPFNEKFNTDEFSLIFEVIDKSNLK